MKFLKFTFLFVSFFSLSFFAEVKGQTSGKGQDNWFSGPRAGAASSENSKDNAFFGHYAGQSNRDGSSNLFLGYAAGVTNTLGSNNTFIGYQAGAYYQGNNNVLIGYNVGFNNDPKQVQENNALRIGNQSEKTLIIGDFVNNKVGIGIHDSNQLLATLNVNGNSNFTGELRFKNNLGTKGIVWGDANWNNTYTRIDDYNGQLHIMTDDNFYLSDINSDGTPGVTRFYVNTDNGIVKIGDPTKTAPASKYLLQVKTGVLSEDFGMANVNNWADYVFKDDYQLRSLEEVETFIQKNKHLPDVPSEAIVQEQGYSLHDINIALLQKIEELTLYTIKQQKQLDAQQQQIETILKEYSNH